MTIVHRKKGRRKKNNQDVLFFFLKLVGVNQRTDPWCGHGNITYSDGAT
ncbi:MAG: hypothetical protein ACI9HY_003029 [Planctomycetaceae bacterium]|jgi:hypothetical protein